MSFGGLIDTLEYLCYNYSVFYKRSVEWEAKT
jgi:hypothetical protein